MQKFRKNQLVTSGPETFGNKVFKVKAIYDNSFEGVFLELHGKDGKFNSNLFRPLTQAEKRQRANSSARAKHEALTSLGLVRVKGSNGGTFYE